VLLLVVVTITAVFSVKLAVAWGLWHLQLSEPIHVKSAKLHAMRLACM
jgi:hypothetical protein